MSSPVAVPAVASRERLGFGRFYGRLWARFPRELWYLLVTAVLGLVIGTAFRLVESIGTSLIVILVGILVFGFLLLGARYLGIFELYRLRAAAMPPIAAPDWDRPFAGKGFFRAIGDVFGNPHHWLYYLHSGILNPALAVITFAIWFPWILTAAAFVLTPVLALIRPFGPGTYVEPQGVDGIVLTLDGLSLTEAWQLLAAGTSANNWLWVAGFTALGLLMVALLPFVTRGLTWAHWGLGRLLLARFKSEDLGAEVERVGAAQRAAVAAEDNALRRLERDIHDGPQQRLLRLQMELAAAERQLPADADRASGAIAEARTLAQEALDELRALAQGFAPPLLQDRGLEAALEALARRSAVPIDAEIRLDRPVPSPIERSAYFVAAELTSNAIKHSAARRIRMLVETRGADEDGRPALVIAVSDDGVGGANPVPGHGLAGAAERLAGLGGTLTVQSPNGGPTEVVATIPLPAS